MLSLNLQITITHKSTMQSLLNLNPKGSQLCFPKKREQKISLANIYCQNAHQVSFVSRICDSLAAFKEGSLILGDFNVPPDPLLDTSTGSASFPFRAFRRMKIDLMSLDLHYTWHFLHPIKKDYVLFTSPPALFTHWLYFHFPITHTYPQMGVHRSNDHFWSSPHLDFTDVLRALTQVQDMESYSDMQSGAR